MKGLLRKDFYVVAKQLKIFLVIIPIITLTAGLYMSPYVLLLGASMPMTVIAYDERSKWNELSVMLPYSKKQLVVSKYLFGYICTLVALTLAAAGQAIAAAMGMELPFGGSLVLFFSTVFVLLYIPLSIPIFLRFGTTKGRLFFITFIALAGASGPLLQNLDSYMLQNIFQRFGLVATLFSILLVVVVNLISITISIRLEKYPR